MSNQNFTSNVTLSPSSTLSPPSNILPQNNYSNGDTFSYSTTTPPQDNKCNNIVDLVNENVVQGNKSVVESTHFGRVKRSCQECSRAKVKCTSTFPKCNRCRDRNINCVYIEEMRRGRRDGNPKNSPINHLRQIPNNDKNNMGFSLAMDVTSNQFNGEKNVGDFKNNIKEKNIVPTIGSPTFQVYRIVNGTPETFVRTLPNKNSQNKRDSESYLNLTNVGNSAKVQGVIDSEKIFKSTKEKLQKKQKVLKSKAPLSEENPSISFAQTSTNVPNIDNPQQIHPSDINILSKFEIRLVEKKIFAIFCELVHHIKILSGTCSCSGFIPLSQQKMNNYIFMTDQLSHFMDVSKEVESCINMTRGIGNSTYQNDINKYIPQYQNNDISFVSLDAMDLSNDIDDRFTIAPALSPSQALKFENSSYKAYIQHLSDPSNQMPYYRLDCTTNSTINDNSNQRPMSSVTTFVNDAFSNVFGYNSSLITWFHQHLQGGLLPFGGDVLALLMDDFNSIRRCLHRITIKTRQSLAMVHSQLIPNSNLCQTFELQFSIGSGDYPLFLRNRDRSQPDFPCTCQILFRNVILPDLSSVGTQMHMSFIPAQPQPNITIEPKLFQSPTMSHTPQTFQTDFSNSQNQQNSYLFSQPWVSSVQMARTQHNPQPQPQPQLQMQQQQNLSQSSQFQSIRKQPNHEANLALGLDIPNISQVTTSDQFLKDNLAEQIQSVASPSNFSSLFSPNSNAKYFSFDDI